MKLFKNPRVKHRKEEWGGILRFANTTLMLDEQAYELFLTVSGKDESELNGRQAKNAQKLIGARMLIRADEETIRKAQKLI